MNRAEYLKQIIDDKGLSVREVAIAAKVPYTTVMTMLSRASGMGGTSVDTVMKVCHVLDITVDELSEQNKNIDLSSDESEIIKKFRLLNEAGRKAILASMEGFLASSEFIVVNSK